jgi:hypothetical protein
MAQFSYIKPADFTPRMKEHYDSWNKSEDSAEQMRRLNDAQRLANAKLKSSAISELAKFSETASKTWQEQQKKRDMQLRNESLSLINDIGADQKEYREWNKANDQQDQEMGYFNWKAGQYRKPGPNQDISLAEELEGLSGHRLKILKRTLLHQASHTWKQGFDESKLDGFTASRVDGSTLTWGEVRTEEDFKTYLDSYNKMYGFNEVGDYNPLFVHKEYFPKYNQEVALARSEWLQKLNVQAHGERERLGSESFLHAAKSGNLGEVVLSYINNSGNHYAAGAKGAREFVIADLMDQVTNKKITPAEVLAMLDYEFTHKGKGKTTLGEAGWDEFNRDEIETQLYDAETKRIERQTKINGAESQGYVATVLDQIQKKGAALTEQEVRDIQRVHRDRFPEVPLPEELKTLSTYTQEDIDDLEHVANMQAKLDQGLPIETKDWMRIKGDDQLRKTWKEKAESDLGRGLNSTYLKQANDDIESKARTVLGMQSGVMDTNTVEYNTLTRNAKAKYAQFYRQGKFETPQEKHDYAIQETLRLLDQEQANPGSTTLSARRSVDRNIHSLPGKSTTALKAIIDGKENGTNALTSGLLPGTEQDYKRVEAYALDPYNNTIPAVYGYIARGLKQNPPLTDWHIANMQYKSQTGKDLPQPNQVKVLESKSPVVQYLITRYPNNSKLKRAAALDKGVDLSVEEVTEGVTPE